MEQKTNRALHLLLPKLKGGQANKMPTVSTAGEWKPHNPATLELLYDSIDFASVDAEINSIPDAWARPLLFEMALYDASHPLHARVVGEWRGLLGLLALRERRHLRELTAAEVEIPAPAATVEDDEAFAHVLGRLLPRESLSAATPWSTLYVLSFDRKPIGVTSPTTLVCTATDYLNRINHVPWFDGRYLSDPVGHLNERERQAFAYWLSELKQNLNEPGGMAGSARSNQLLGLLNALVADLDSGVNTRATDFDLGLDGLGMSAGLFVMLDRAVAADQGVSSHVRIVSERAKRLDKAILFVSAEIASQWRMEEREVVVWRNITLDMVRFSGLHGDRGQIAGAPLEGAEWRVPSDFFAETLFLVDQPNALPGALLPDGATLLEARRGTKLTPLLPVSTALLDYFSPEELARAMRFRETADGIHVSLTLPLAGTEGVERPYTIEKVYPLDDDHVKVVLGMPVLELWPNIRTPSWHAYYSYCSLGGQTTFLATPYRAGAPVADGLVRDFKKAGDKLERRVTRTSFFPEAYVCEMLAPRAQAGLILLKEPAESTPSGHVLKVGVDFGTSSTHVYAKGTTDQPYPLEFRFSERFLNVSASGTSRTELYDNFMPTEQEETPFLSLFHELKPANATPQPPEPLLDGHILFLKDNARDFHAARTDGVVADMKWGDHVARYRAKAFLEQLCLQCAAEAAVANVSTISWRFSFPTAFSGQDEASFRLVWGDIVGGIAAATGIAAVNGKAEATSESVSAAQFFSHPPGGVEAARFPKGAVIVDIGGATSDVSIWQGVNELRMKASLRFAGRDILLELLRAWPDFLSQFGVDTQRLRDVVKREAIFFAQADAVIRTSGQEVVKGLPYHLNDPNVTQFLTLLRLGVCGLFYYIGLLIHFLEEKHRFAAQVPDIYVGGNGSQILHWLAGPFDGSGPSAKLIKAVFADAAGLPIEDYGSFGVHLSPLPKAEVSYGLVLDYARLQHDEALLAECIAGERFSQDGNQSEWATAITVDDAARGMRVAADVPMLHEFVNSFNKHSSEVGFPSSAVAASSLEGLAAQIDQDLVNLQQKDAFEIRLEPVFLLGLRHLLAKLTKEWVDRNRK